MFSKNSNVKSENGVSRDKPTAASVPSLISADLSIVGNLKCAGDVQVDGSVKGNVISHAITIGKNAGVEGDLICEKLTIYGGVDGTIRAKDVSIMSSARVTGDIYHESLSIEPGAKIMGKVDRLEEATEKTAAPTPVATKGASAAEEKAFSVVGGKDIHDTGAAAPPTTAVVQNR